MKNKFCLVFFTCIIMLSCSKKMEEKVLENMSNSENAIGYLGKNGSFIIGVSQYANQVIQADISGFIADKNTKVNINLGDVKIGALSLNNSNDRYNSGCMLLNCNYVNKTPAEISTLFGKNVQFQFDGNESKGIEVTNETIEMPELIHLTSALDKDYFRIENDENIVLTWTPSSQKGIYMSYGYTDRNGKSIKKLIPDNGTLVIPRSEIETFGAITVPIYLRRYTGNYFDNNGYKYILVTVNTCRVGDYTIVSEINNR